MDSQNLVFSYVKSLNKHSMISAEYMIKSTYNGVTAYIFIRKRKEKKDQDYCICSFFVDPPVAYTGQKAYWWFKAKYHILTERLQIFIDKTDDSKQTDI